MYLFYIAIYSGLHRNVLGEGAGGWRSGQSTRCANKRTRSQIFGAHGAPPITPDSEGGDRDFQGDTLASKASHICKLGV